MVLARCGVPVLVALLAVQSPSLETVLAAAGRYAAAFRDTTPVLVADETYTQISTEFGSTHRDLFATGAPAGEAGARKVRKLRSEFAMAAAGSLWLAFRDVFEVDGRALRPERNTLQDAFADTAAGSAKAAALTADAAKHNVGSMNRNVNVPTFALSVVLPENQAGFTFTKKGEKKIGGIPAWVIAYTETRRPTLARTPDGTSQPMRGELSIDPTSGRVLKTQIVFDSLDAYPDMKVHPERYREFPRTTIEVTYAADPKLDVWVPVEMKELYDRPSELVNCTATYSNFRRPTVSRPTGSPVSRSTAADSLSRDTSTRVTVSGAPITR